MDGEQDTWKTAVDGLLITPLFVVPIVGGLAGLWLIKRNGFGLNRSFWRALALINGFIFAWLANLPFNVQYPPSCSPYQGIEGIFSIVIFGMNAIIWFTVIHAASLIINRFAFPIITMK
jgi:hypothetical protein